MFLRGDDCLSLEFVGKLTQQRIRKDEETYEAYRNHVCGVGIDGFLDSVHGAGTCCGAVAEIPRTRSRTGMVEKK